MFVRYDRFQNIVPISLYISIEVVRTCQAAFIYFDKEIWYEKTDQPTLARSWNLSDDLGQVEYIFSDKTGTLTQVRSALFDLPPFSCGVGSSRKFRDKWDIWKYAREGRDFMLSFSLAVYECHSCSCVSQNLMVFRRCSIGGKVYRGDDDAEGEVVLLDQKSSKSIQDLLPPSVHQSPSHTSVDKAPPTGDSARTEKPLGGEHFHDTALATDIATAATADKPGERDRLNGFFTVLALCHTVLAAVDPHTGALDYKAQSPDEAALVQAAADVGFEFRGRDKDVLFLKTPFEPEVARFRLLNILEFTSARKRMSVIVRRLAGGDENREEEVGELMLLSKGADNVIFERLAPGAERLKAETEAQLDEFAREGLRTLTLACRTVDAGEYAAWSARYAEATAAIDDREELVERVSEEIEGGLVLLGATAIEDRLQDGVPEAIADLKKAGIKIWVATGDKLETAIGA